jgi:hypothetical protein
VIWGREKEFDIVGTHNIINGTCGIRYLPYYELDIYMVYRTTVTVYIIWIYTHVHVPCTCVHKSIINSWLTRVWGFWLMMQYHHSNFHFLYDIVENRTSALCKNFSSYLHRVVSNYQTNYVISINMKAKTCRISDLC